MKPLRSFITGFLSLVYGPSSLRNEHGYAKGRAERSTELQAELQARAALKRQRKAKKRVHDNFRCVRNNYAGHSTNYLV